MGSRRRAPNAHYEMRALPLSDIMTFAHASPARNKIIILDSCHSGALGESHLNNQVSEVGEGMAVLTASTKNQYAAENNGGGLFTGLLVDALSGAAANGIGEITPGSVYAHIDQSLGSWSQRPVFKTNVKSFVSLRNIPPPLPVADLQRITEFFPKAGHEYQLAASLLTGCYDRDRSREVAERLNGTACVHRT